MLEESKARESIASEEIENELIAIIEKLSFVSDVELKTFELKYKGVKVVNKLEVNYSLLRRKIESYVCTYAGVYKGYRIFCMNLTVSVNEYGVRGAAGSLFSIRGYYGLSSPICAPDEALMTLLHSIETDGQTRFITEMDLGYDLQESGDVSGNLKLVPCYYMYLQGESRPIIVDAYTNEIKN